MVEGIGGGLPNSQRKNHLAYADNRFVLLWAVVSSLEATDENIYIHPPQACSIYIHKSSAEYHLNDIQNLPFPLAFFDNEQGWQPVVQHLAVAQ